MLGVVPGLHLTLKFRRRHRMQNDHLINTCQQFELTAPSSCIIIATGAVVPTIFLLDHQCPFRPPFQQCRREDDTRIPSNGVQRYRNWDWIDLVQEGHYDYVYVQEDYICLASCWYKPWESTCVQPDPHANRTYCRKLTCKHDEGNRNNHGDRYSGCHSDRQSGQRKEPWHR